MKKIISILITAFVMSVPAAGHAWNIDRDFNSGTLGTKAFATRLQMDLTTLQVQYMTMPNQQMARRRKHL